MQSVDFYHHGERVTEYMSYMMSFSFEFSTIYVLFALNEMFIDSYYESQSFFCRKYHNQN